MTLRQLRIYHLLTARLKEIGKPEDHFNAEYLAKTNSFYENDVIVTIDNHHCSALYSKHRSFKIVYEEFIKPHL